MIYGWPLFFELVPGGETLRRSLGAGRRELGRNLWLVMCWDNL